MFKCDSKLKLIHTKNNNTSKYAFVLCVFKDYLYLLGALACAYSLRLTKTNYDIVCMVTNDIDKNLLSIATKLFDKIIEVPYLELDTIDLRTMKQRKMYSSWKNISITKWNCLGLYNYEKVLFIDADKIILQNIDHLFELQTPAGTFSSPHAQGYTKNGGMFNPYFNLQHGDIVSKNSIHTGLYGNEQGEHSFVVIGSMILLSPSETIFNSFHNMLKQLQKSQFGFSLCNSGMDEQLIVYFYTYHLNNKHTWTYISQKYNFIAWDYMWIRSHEYPPHVLHFFGTKPWILNRNEWLDLEIWWTYVTNMLNNNYFEKEQHKLLIKLYNSNNNNLKESHNKGCFYCKLYKRKWKEHNFINYNCNIKCPSYIEENKKLSILYYNNNNNDINTN